MKNILYMEHLKKYEEYSIVNKSDLDIVGNWSADYIYHTKAGRKPYTKKGFLLTEITFAAKKKSGGRKKSLPSKGVVWLKPESAEKLNNIGSAITKKIELYNELFDALVYEQHEKGYEDEELKSRGRTSGVIRKEDDEILKL
jgi:hypothetical protein